MTSFKFDVIIAPKCRDASLEKETFLLSSKTIGHTLTQYPLRVGSLNLACWSVFATDRN